MIYLFFVSVLCVLRLCLCIESLLSSDSKLPTGNSFRTS